MADVDEVIERLRSISEDLADQAIAVLSEASREGRSERPEQERALTQARRAVEKAIAVLERSRRGSGG